MFKKMIVTAGLGVALAAGQAMAQEKVESATVTCDDLYWSAEVLA